MKTDVLRELARGTEYSQLASHALEAIERQDANLLVKIAEKVDQEFNKIKPKNADNPLVGAYAEIIGAYVITHGAFPSDASKVMEWALLHAAFTEGPAFFGEE